MILFASILIIVNIQRQDPLSTCIQREGGREETLTLLNSG
jgi:hypothetical protein